MARSTFLRNGRGVFKCYTCGRSCRQTSETGDSECCIHCYELAGYENELSDEGKLSLVACGVIEDLGTQAREAGGDANKLYTSFKELFDYVAAMKDKLNA